MTFAAGDAHDFCIYKGRYRFSFPILDADGDPVTAATGLDSERSIDFAAGADCTNEATEFTTAPLGMYFLDLTSAETTGSNVSGVTKTTSSGAKTTCWTIPIVRLPVLESGTAQAGAAGTITLASGASAKDGFYNGLYVQCSNDTPANALGQTRKVISYVGSTRVATVESNWGTNPSSSTTYDILIPLTANVAAILAQRMPDWSVAGVPEVDVTHWIGTAAATPTVAGVPEVDVTHFNGTAGTFAAGRPEVNTTHAAGTAWGSGAITAASIAADAITAAKIANGAIDAATFAAGAIDAAAIADGAIDAATLAADTITAAKVAADVSTEFATTFFGTAIPGAFGAGTAGSRLGKLPDVTAGAAGGVFIAGTNAATTITTALTTTFTGNLTGSVGSVTGAVGSVTGAVGSVTGAVGSVTGNVGGNVNGSVGTVNALAANSITAAATAADFSTEVRSLASGTSDSGTTTTMVDAVRTEADADYWKDQIIVFTSGNIAGQARLITGFTPASDTITFSPATTQAVTTQTYEIWPSSRVDLAQIAGADVSTSTAQLGINVVNYGGVAGTFSGGRPEVNTSHASGTAWNSGAISASTLAADTITAAKIANAAIDAATFAAGAIDAAAIANGAIDAATFAAGAIDAAALAADAGTEIAAAVWNEDATTHQTAGTFGKAIGDPLASTNSLIQRTPDATAGAAGGLFIAGTNAATTVTTALTTTFTGNLTGSVGSVTGLTASNLDATVSSRATPAQVSIAVWDEDATGHQTQGTFGRTIGDQVADADSIWSLTNTNLDATVSSRAAASDLATVQADTDNIQTRLPAALESGRMAAALDATGIDAILDDPIEGSMTLRQAMRIVLAACANKLSGAATTTVTIRDLADTKARITATVDADGNRSAVTLDAT